MRYSVENKMIKRLFLMLVVLGLSSCGYRLCNPCAAWPDDVQQVYVSTSEPSSPVYGYLRENLRTQSLDLVESETHADAVFVLLRESQSKRLLAVGNGNEPAEYELIYKVDFRIDRKNHQSGEGRPVTGGAADPSDSASKIGALPFVLGKAQSVESRRAQVFNPAAVLAVEQEAQSLYDEMARYLANQITRVAVGQVSEAAE